MINLKARTVSENLDDQHDYYISATNERQKQDYQLKILPISPAPYLPIYLS